MALSKQRCILGLDLSSTTDLTALAAWFSGVHSRRDGKAFDERDDPAGAR
jgi:phage terminase large subunit-like protein